MRISAHLDVIFDGLTLRTAILQYFMLHFELNVWYNHIFIMVKHTLKLHESTHMEYDNVDR